MSFFEISEKSHKNIVSIAKNLNIQDIAVMCSGGADSMAVLHYLVNFFSKRKRSINIHVLYVNHSISPYSSDWEGIVFNFSKQYNDLYKENVSVIFSSHKIKWEENEIKSETNCRKKRYDWILKYCKDNQVNHIFTGHHKNDLFENNLISIFRNRTQDFSLLEKYTSKDGFSFYKIFLSNSKNEIFSYCENNRIIYVTDESNFESGNIRNVIRNDLMNGIKNLGEKEYSHYMNAANAFFEHYSMLNEFINEFVKNKFEELKNNNFEYIAFNEFNNNNIYWFSLLLKDYCYNQWGTNLSNSSIEQIVKKMKLSGFQSGKNKIKVNENLTLIFNTDDFKIIFSNKIK